MIHDKTSRRPRHNKCLQIDENKFNDGDLEQAIFSIIDSNKKMKLYSDNSKLYSKRDSSILIKEKLKEIMLNAR